jgi:hypothetical protein
MTHQWALIYADKLERRGATYVPEDIAKELRRLHAENVRLKAELADALATIEFKEHLTDGTKCWCEPDLDYVDPETGAEVWVHRKPS